MFWIKIDPSSGSFILCLAKNYSNGSIVSVDMDVVVVMVAHLPVVRVCTVYRKVYTGTLDKHCIKLPDDGSLVIRNMLEQF